MIRYVKKAWLGVLAAIGLAGCAVGPDYQAPKPAAPAAWNSTQPGITATSQPSVQWWSTLKDPLLDSLIERAVKSNIDLQIAAQRVREARALRGEVYANLWPTVDGSGAYTHSRQSANGIYGTPGAQLEHNLFETGFDAGWEIDVFGGVRRSVEAADADLEASQFSQQGTLVTLLAEVARNYVELRGTQKRIALTVDNIATQKDTLALTESRFQAGLISELSVAQARSQLATTQARIPQLQTSLKRSIYRLSVLLGQEPAALLEECNKVAPIPPIPPDVPVGLPAELLRRRPDIRQAERRIAASNARIGEATSDLLPKFALNGSIGLSATDAGKLVRGDSAVWGLGPSMQWRLFDGGKIRSNIEVQNARTEQARLQYNGTVLSALEEVENALVAYAQEQRRRESLVQAVDASQRALSLSSELFAKGLTDFLNVLEGQRTLYTAQDQLAQCDQDVTLFLIALYKSLGGGWTPTNRE